MFTITAKGNTSSVFFVTDSDEYSGVRKIAAKVCHDVELVTGAAPRLCVTVAECTSGTEDAFKARRHCSHFRYARLISGD